MYIAEVFESRCAYKTGCEPITFPRYPPERADNARGVVFWCFKLILFVFNGRANVINNPTSLNLAPDVLGKGTHASCKALLKAPSNRGDCKRR